MCALMLTGTTANRKRKQERRDDKSEGLHGGRCIASLAAGVFLIRDGHLPGESIGILEELPVAAGSLDASGDPSVAMSRAAAGC